MMMDKALSPTPAFRLRQIGKGALSDFKWLRSVRTTAVAVPGVNLLRVAEPVAAMPSLQVIGSTDQSESCYLRPYWLHGGQNERMRLAETNSRWAV